MLINEGVGHSPTWIFHLLRFGIYRPYFQGIFDIAHIFTISKENAKFDKPFVSRYFQLYRYVHTALK